MRYLLLLGAVSLSFAGDIRGWDKEKAAHYLDERQKEWLAFKPAEAPHGACVSCHTGVVYLMARPALRRALREPGGPNVYEAGLVQGLEKRLHATEGARSMFPRNTTEPKVSESAGVEAVLAAFQLHDRPSLDRLWATQIREGADAGAWKWFDLGLYPWETTTSKFYGAALAAVAAAQAPPDSRNSPAARTGRQALIKYILREQASQPLHQRLTLLWAATEGLKSVRREIARQALTAQQPDGGWTIASLGPWTRAPRNASPDSDCYATALTAFSLIRSGLKASDPRLKRALDWLQTHQDHERGIWTAQSMNKEFKAGSMPAQFMNDAATSFAVLALVEGGRF